METPPTDHGDESLADDADARPSSGQVTESAPTDRAQTFYIRDAALAAHVALKFDNPVPIDLFEEIVGDYRFKRAEWVKCQLNDNAGYCGTDHGWGVIARLKDRTKGVIGHDCVDRHAKTDPRFAVIQASVTRLKGQLDKNRAQDRLQVALADLDIKSKVQSAFQRWERLQCEMLRIRGTLPQSLRKEISRREKDNSTQVFIKVFYFEIEIDSKGREKKIYKPQLELWGALRGLSCLNETRLYAIGRKIREADSALLEARAADDESTKNMNRWSGKIDYVADGRFLTDLDQHEAAVRNFSDMDSLRLLWLLTSDRMEQLSAARAALEIVTRKRVSDQQAEEARSKWEGDIQATYPSLDFETTP